MATTVPNNPYDTQQPSAPVDARAGLVRGAMAPTGNLSQVTPKSSTLPSNVGATKTVAPDVATYAPTQRTVDKPTETVAGQMDSILSNDSPLMQRARTLAKQGMAQRGLVNSSMSQGAGVASMIDRATPIAAQDAQTFGQAASDNMNALNQSGQFNATELNKFGLQKGQQDFSATQAQLDRDSQFKMVEFQNSLQNANVSKSFAADVARGTLATVNSIQADPNLTPDAKKAALQNVIDTGNSTMQWGSTFYNTNLPTIAAPNSTASTLNPGGSYQTAGASQPAAMPSNFSALWQTAHDVTGDFSTVAPYIKGKTIEQVMKDTGANRRDAIYMLQKVGN